MFLLGFYMSDSESRYFETTDFNSNNSFHRKQEMDSEVYNKDSFNLSVQGPVLEQNFNNGVLVVPQPEVKEEKKPVEKKIRVRRFEPNYKKALNRYRRTKKKGTSGSYLMTKKEKVILTIIFVLLLIYALTLIYPFFYLLLNSFKTFEDFTKNPIWFTPNAVITNYINVFTNFNVQTLDGEVGVLEMFWNSVSLSVVETIVSMFFTCCAAYVLAKYKFVGNKFIYTFVIVSSVVPSIAAITALYKMMVDVQLMGTFIGMILLNAGAFGGGFLYIHSYFKSIPWSFAESAMIDGASDFKIFYKIMIPMAKNGILTFTILRFLGFWNEYWIPYLFYQDHPTLAVGLAKLSHEAVFGQYPTLFAAMIVSIVPVLIFYAIFQKKLLANTVDGGLK